jgi:hypothetical protein
VRAEASEFPRAASELSELTACPGGIAAKIAVVQGLRVVDRSGHRLSDLLTTRATEGKDHTAMPRTATISLPIQSDDQLVRFTVDDYLKVMEHGGVCEGAPIELLDGLFVRKDRRDHEGDIMVVGIRHGLIVDRIYQWLLFATVAHGAWARSQQPLKTSKYSLPEPDVMMLAGSINDYTERYASPADVLLLIEVADSSLSFDRTDKLEKYARAGVPEYWVVNLVQDQIEIHTAPEPQAGTYRQTRIVDRGGAVTVICPDGHAVTTPVAELLK